MISKPIVCEPASPTSIEVAWLDSTAGYPVIEVMLTSLLGTSKAYMTLDQAQAMIDQLEAAIEQAEA